MFGSFWCIRGRVFLWDRRGQCADLGLCLLGFSMRVCGVCMRMLGLGYVCGNSMHSRVWNRYSVYCDWSVRVEMVFKTVAILWCRRNDMKVKKRYNGEEEMI